MSLRDIAGLDVDVDEDNQSKIALLVLSIIIYLINQSHRSLTT